MNFTEIREFVLAKKKYILFILLILACFFFFKKNEAAQDAKVVSNQEPRQDLRAKSSASASRNQAPSTVTVDITGAVKHEGVYTLKNGARINELIQAAGGLRNNAQLKTINRAVMLKDQDKVHIPYRGEKIDNSVRLAGEESSTNSVAAVSDSQDSNDEAKINLNTASAADLQKLSGIGEKKAAAIIKYRQQKGQFKKIEDLLQVSGIGEKTFAKLKGQLSI